MDVLSRIRAEVERELIASESAILLRRIRERLHELKFGELQELLASPAGQLLHERALGELLPSKREARRPEKRRVKQATIARALLAALHASRRPLSLRELCAAVPHGLRQVQRAMQQLRARGQVLMVDPAPRPTYWAQQGGEYTGKTTASRNTAEVVAALRTADRGLSLRELCAATGLTEDRMRKALARLVESGQVSRAGRSIATHYALTAARPASDASRARPAPEGRSTAAD